MTNQTISANEWSAARRFAIADTAKLHKLVLACKTDGQHYRCYITDFSGTVDCITVTKSQIKRCDRFVSRLRAKVDKFAAHWTRLLGRQDVARYWQREVEIALQRGDIIANEIAQLRLKNERKEELAQVRRSDIEASTGRSQGTAA